MTERISCIDIGTNTALLLIADLDPEEGTVEPVFHKQTIIRLGEHVDEMKIIDPEARQRLISCLRDYSALSAEHKAESVIAVGTSALRDAKNRMEVTSETVRSTGIVIRCISGEEEAELTFFGAVTGMRDIPETFTVVDIGGGSTELSMGSVDGVSKSVSMDIGSVRLTERFFSALPPSQEEFARARQEVNRVLTGGVLPFFEAREKVFGVAGTLTTLAQLAQGMREFDPEKVHGYRLGYEDVRRILERLKASSQEEILQMGVPEGRADVITMGALIVHQLMRLLGIGEIQVSGQGLRYGIALQELKKLRAEE
ncbi:Ppx/GppA phosphatase family protein [Chlorobium sp. N1]|uniref:Ppx/GppA phosphatase family protein n=1 Tax=Chlorobium sp. N1 TaxID=2491138 RepID=UPI0010392C84|nr:Ppx/GppA phosphatase family protein [Chlorobium sp. N1]TCD48133.1 Ppx/GppA family phosphatase [Chlorobium sp. N1]